MLPRKIANMGRILISGANGALGQTLIGLLGPEIAVTGTRRQNWYEGSFDHFCLTNDEAIEALDWQKFTAVINVAGLVRGSMDKLIDANVSFPTKLARAARKGGVKQFVQVSSFAVYGFAEYIDESTPEVPANDYGHTKAEGDRQLHALAADNFSIASLRLPFLFDAEHPALFRQLFNVIRMLPYFPVASQPMLRSMISYADAALMLRVLAEERMTGIFHAAAPTPFNMDILTKLILQESGFRLRTVRLPDLSTAAIRLGAPALHRRLFKSNVLDPEINIAMNRDDILDLENPLRDVVRKHFR